MQLFKLSFQVIQLTYFKYFFFIFLKLFLSEYGLVNTSWEKQIIDHFINTNTDPKTTENIRVVDMENLEKYFVTTLSKSLKEDVLTEFLRSAGCEKSRVINLTSLYFTYYKIPEAYFSNKI